MSKGYSEELPLDALDLLADEAGSHTPRSKERVRYTVKLNPDSDYFAMSTDELYKLNVDIDVEHDGKHTFKVIGIDDRWPAGDGKFTRTLMLEEI